MKKAYCIGLNYSKTDKSLLGPSVDSANMKSLAEKFGYDVTVLDDTTGTKKNLFKVFNTISKLPPGSSVFFTYSGHGKQKKDKDNDEIDNMDECICPIKNYKDGTQKLDTMTDDEIRENLINKVPENVKLIAIFDCCNSGTICDMRYVVKTDSIQKDKRYPKLQASISCLASCRDDQSALDGPFGGLFTNNFLRVLQEFNYDCTYRQLFNKLTYIFSDGVFNPYLSLSNPNIYDSPFQL